MSKPKKPSLRTREPGDPTYFNNANDMLEALGVRYRRPDRHQLKIGKINYYPKSGSIHIDGHSKPQPKRGLDALQTLLLDQRMRLGVYIAKRSAAEEKRDREQRERDAAALDVDDPNRALINAAKAVDVAIGNFVRGEADVGPTEEGLVDS